MTASTATPPPGGSTGPAPLQPGIPQTPLPRRGGPNRRRWITFTALGTVGLIVVVGLLAVLITSASSRSADSNSAMLDPANPGSSGTRALARVIAGHGGDLTVARDQRQFLGAGTPGPDTTVVITGDSALNSYTAAQLRRQVRQAGRVVVLSPRSTTLQLLRLPVEADYSATFAVPQADCVAPGIRPSDRLAAATGTYTLVGGTRGTSCFPSHKGADASVVVVPATATEPQYVVAGGVPFTNGQITRADNAGVGVRMIGGLDRVIWYIPSTDDTAPRPASAPSDIPRAIGPLIALSAVALLAAMLWRGRRFGQLVTEPLPAVVKAVETTEARGRLYYRARDAQRAGQQLRDYTAARLTRSLGLPRGVAAQTLVESAAAATDVDVASIRALLVGPLPDTDDQLLQFANDLSRLEEKVHRRP